MLESYSSLGGAPILFAYSGARLTTPEVRQKPDVVGPDGANTTFFGLTLAEDGIVDSSSIGQCADDTTYPNFFGTSAATPHVAGIAALLLAANSANTPALVYSALRSSALPMGPSTPNFSSGYGFVQADSALALLPAAPASHSSGGGGLGGTALLILAALVATRLSTRRHQHLRGAHRH
jgi:subtilisin family serine protease